MSELTGAEKTAFSRLLSKLPAQLSGYFRSVKAAKVANKQTHVRRFQKEVLGCNGVYIGNGYFDQIYNVLDPQIYPTQHG